MQSVDVEQALKVALAPLAMEARRSDVEIACEILPSVGGLVYGDVTPMIRGITRATARAVEALAAVPDAKMAGPREVWIRLARQHSGFAPTPTVFVTVQPRGLLHPVGVVEIEATLEAGASRIDAVLDAMVLVVSRSANAGRILSEAIARTGAEVTLAQDSRDATTRLRDASAGGPRFQAVVVDDAIDDRGIALLGTIATDSSLGSPRSVLCAVGGVGPASLVIQKPALPTELARALKEKP